MHHARTGLGVLGSQFDILKGVRFSIWFGVAFRARLLAEWETVNAGAPDEVRQERYIYSILSIGSV